ncbi:MAG: glycosyltransferase family 9 protein [Planctomycetes bacterium]|nr:glycosyltransferase family 9 protein [Planctomycetota bacterium]
MFQGRSTGSPMRIGYNRDGRGWLLTHSINVEKSVEPTPTIDYYAHLVRTALRVEDIDLRMELFVTPADSSAADKILHDVKDPFVLLNPGGNKPLKRWPVERFALLADHLASTYGMVTVLSGAPGERDILEAVMEQVSPQTPLVNLVDRDLNLGNLKAIVQRAALMITNDTGPRHIAAALGTPLITLFGPTDHRWTTINYPNERIILAQPFLPEEQIADQHAATCRIDRISVSDVAARVKELLTIDK